MITYEEALQMLEGIMDEYPHELFKDLSGGVIFEEHSDRKSVV